MNESIERKSRIVEVTQLSSKLFAHIRRYFNVPSNYSSMYLEKIYNMLPRVLQIILIGDSLGKTNDLILSWIVDVYPRYTINMLSTDRRKIGEILEEQFEMGEGGSSNKGAKLVNFERMLEKNYQKRISSPKLSEQ